MMDRTANKSRPVPARGPIIEAVCEQLAERVDADRRELVTRFARLFLEKAPPELLDQRGEEALAGLALDSFRFLEDARPNRIDVEVLNPAVLKPGARTAPVTVVRTNISERPFVVDTIREYLHAQELEIAHFIYPVLRVVRDEDGRIRELGPASDGEPRESLVYCEVSRITDRDRLEAIDSAIRRHLEDVVLATDDFKPMLQALDDTVEYLESCGQRLPERCGEIEEIQEFLRWLRDGGFVFLGYRAYDISESPDVGRVIQAESGSGLGILRDEAGSRFADPVPLAELPDGLRERVEGGPLLITSKTNARSTVHRRARMDYIGVKKLDDEGRVAGERRFIGLFTSFAYSEDAEDIPILREKLREILDAADAIPGSHDYKETITIFNSMPNEELFLTSAEEIGAEIQTVLTLYGTREVKVVLRPDPLERGVSVMVILPRERFSGEVRREIEHAFVERFEGEVLNYHLALGGGDQARLHFYISAPPEKLGEVDPAELEQVVQRFIRSWTDRLRERLEAVRPGEEAHRLARRYGEAFSPEYRAAASAETAEQDILTLEAMEADGRTVSVSLANSERSHDMAVAEPVTRLKVALRAERLVLSDFMPILENAGLRALAMRPYEVAGPEVPQATIYVFAVQNAAGEPIDLVERGGALSDAILAVRAGAAADDPLNALVLGAGLAWREVDVLRAYAEYAFQLGVVPSRASLPGALRSYPQAARLHFHHFAIKFDPAAGLSREERERKGEAIRRDLVRSLENVRSLSDDRALRRLLTLIDATVRTNYYRHGGASPTSRSGGVPYVSLKLAGEALRDIARTPMLYELWVHSARMAGVHLRGAKVARGGIRWSDRPDDFRAEVLGLVKTQTVKNAVIVPAGSKGGFITRRQLDDPAAMGDEAADQYRTLMRGLLDLTDNLAAGSVQRPPDVVAYDAPDPYLVVAADKGTAHLSDVANEVAAEYDFWLGDAFASGGSHGYDHKEVGITARGGWECVKRHFWELGEDIQSEPHTVVGIGDMSGDVFGNGMLLSDEIRLIAAFDHRHVFVDPDPDPAASFAERERLFHGGRTSWDDYDRSALSEGGFIVERGAKQVELSPEAREALGLGQDVERLDGESLIRAVLSAPADLLWNGGIGTYLKASDETDAEVGDAANDAVRIDATELRVRVVGEGGNLGFTQRARIQFALEGGRLNIDAIDNSGGVDMSDHEVNLKILLNGPVADGVMTFEERNELLEALTGDVTEHVITDSRSQSRAISLDEIRVEEDGTDDSRALMVGLERTGLLDRAAERLPSTETLARREEEDETLTRPELAVLLAYSKLGLKARLLDSRLPDESAVEDYLLEYFPSEALRAAGEESLLDHRLRREIVATQLTNDIVDLMGSAWVSRMVRETGHSAVDIVRGWLIAARLSNARDLRARLAGLEGEMPAADVYRWRFGLARVLERTARWVLANVAHDAPTARVIVEHRDGLGTLRDSFGEIVAGEERRVFEARVAEMQELTPDVELAQRLVTLRFLDQLLEILRVAREVGADPIRVARAYYLSSELLSVPWMRASLFEAAGEDRWDQREAQALVEDLGRAHRLLTGMVISAGPESESIEALLERVREHRSRELTAFRELVDEIRAADGHTLSALALAVRGLRTLEAGEAT